MSIDILTIIGTLVPLIAAGICLLVTIEAVEIGRALVSQVFRRRAFWIATVGVFILSVLVVGEVPFLASSAVSFILFLALIAVVFAFVDSTVLAAIETDFFHRNTLHWKQLRWPSYAIVLGLFPSILVYIVFGSSTNPPAWVSDQISAVGAGTAVVILYSVVALAVAARRTPNKTMKRHVRLLGFAVACFAIAVANAFTLSLDLYAIPAVVAALFLYRATMTLSPIGRIEEDAVTNLKSGESVAASSEKGGV